MAGNIPGTSIPIPDWWPGQSKAPPTTVDTSVRDQHLATLAAAHGGFAGQPSPVLDKQGQAVSGGYQHYTFNDGSSIEISPDAAVWSSDIKAPKSTAPSGAIGNSDVGYYVVDASQPNGVRLVVPPKTPNADDEMTKALERMDREREMQEKQANQAAGRGYQTNADYQKMADEAKNTGLRADELTEKIRQFDLTQGESKRQFDIAQAAKDKTDAADVLLKGAQTGQVGAQTAAILQTTDINAQKLPGELAQQAATLATTLANKDLTDAQRQQILLNVLQGQAPKVQAAPSQNQLYNYQYNPNTGQMSPTGMNVEYMPKTMADVNARVGQIQSLMQQKSTEIQGKVDNKTITPDQGMQEWNSWYQQNVASQQGTLQAAQQQAIEEQNRLNYAQAAQAGNEAVSSAKYKSSSDYLTNALGAIGTGSPNWGALNAVPLTNPDYDQIRNQGVMEALKFISPTAAQATGTPMPDYGNINIASALSGAPYMPRGAGAPVGAGVGGGAPAGPTPEQIANQNAAGTQITQLNGGFGAIGPGGMASVVPPAQARPYPGGFGAISPGGMAGLMSNYSYGG